MNATATTSSLDPAQTAATRSPHTGTRRGIRRALAGAALVVGTFAAASPTPAAAALTTTATSSYGATLNSNGYCGGPSTGFWITSSGFEWLRITVINGNNRAVGTWFQVGQRYSVWIPLPIATPGNAYVIEGWDATPSGGEVRAVATSFLRVPDLTYRTWFC